MRRNAGFRGLKKDLSGVIARRFGVKGDDTHLSFT